MLRVGHFCGDAVITAGNRANVAGLVYIAVFAPVTGESAASISQKHPPAGIDSLVPDSDG